MLKLHCSNFGIFTGIIFDVPIFTILTVGINWAPPSEFVSSSIPSWQTLTAHAQPFRGARDLVFCLKVPLDSLLVWASSGGSGETARMRRLAWTFAARIGDKYQIRLARPNWNSATFNTSRQVLLKRRYFNGKHTRKRWAVVLLTRRRTLSDISVEMNSEISSGSTKALSVILMKSMAVYTVMRQSFWTDRSGQTSVDPDQTAPVCLFILDRLLWSKTILFQF